jgi:hypothetical protein
MGIRLLEGRFFTIWTVAASRFGSSKSGRSQDGHRKQDTGRSLSAFSRSRGFCREYWRLDARGFQAFVSRECPGFDFFVDSWQREDAERAQRKKAGRR